MVRYTLAKMSNKKLMLTVSLSSPLLLKVWSVDQQRRHYITRNVFEIQNLRFHPDLLNQKLFLNRIQRGFI